MLPLCFAAMFCFGVVLVLVGANQAELARDLGLDLAASGLLGAALALGIGIGVTGAGPVFDRYPRRPLFVASALLAGLALLGVQRDISFERALLHVVGVGIGAGAYDTLVNAAIVERFRERAAKPMSGIHSAATLGAMLAPLGIGWLASRGHWTGSFRLTGAAHLALAAAALAVRFPAPRPSERVGSGRTLSPALAPFAAVAFSYVGVEAALTIFAVPYATGGLALDADRGRAAISAFWLGLFAGRMGVLALRRAPGAGMLTAAGVAGGAVLAAGVVGAVTHVELLFGLAGGALGCVYPLMIALAGQRFPRARGTAAGLAAGAGALGGFAIPWLTGAIGDAAGVGVAVGSLALWSFAIAASAVVARGR